MPKLNLPSLRDAVAAKIARALGLAPDTEGQEEDPEEYRVLPNRADRRAAGMRQRTSRMRPTPHPHAGRGLGPARPLLAAKREKQVERLQAAYNRTVETGGTWIAPDVEQAYRDRRAARARARAGRRAARRSR